jgi:uncharacterized protein (TIGR02996 family)
MPDLMAIVSKAVFEKEAGKNPAVGTRLGMDRYVSTNKALDPLGKGGRLYLVTVRPPNEALWLVAILDKPKHDGEAWIAKKCATPITDISKLRSKIKFESGAGITAKKGALGMSLQTPRALTAADAALLDAAAGVAAGAAPEDPATAVDAERADGLLEAIIADPDSDDARRIYADLLVQHNDPRGEFILVDLALDGPLSIRKRAQLSQRRRELYDAHAKRWFPYALGGMRTHHGFLQAVRGSLKQLKAVASKVFAAEPVTEVELTGVDEETVEPLLAARWLLRVQRLTVRGELGDDGFARLCASSATANLRSLNVRGAELSAAALANLGDGLPRCTSLVLSGNPIGDDGLAALHRWTHLPAVEALYLSGADISAKGLLSLLRGAGGGTSKAKAKAKAEAKPQPQAPVALTALTKLCLTDNDDLGDEAAGILASHAALLPNLRHLELINTGLGGAGLKLLADAPLPSLRRLDVRRNDLSGKLAADPRIKI